MDLSKVIKKCIANDRVAQKQLYHLFADHVMHIAIRYAVDLSQAKDITQNTFIRIFMNLEQFKPQKGKFRNWISKITIHEAINLKRKNDNWFSVEYPPSNITDDLCNEAISHFNTEEIRYNIKKLPIQFQTILQMYYFDELSHKEIAELLNIKESSSRSKLTRARRLFIHYWRETKPI